MPEQIEDQEANASSQSENGSPDEREIPKALSLLPLREGVLFPGMVAPLHVTRENVITLIDEAAAKGNRYVAVAALRNPDVEEPTLADVHTIGTAAYIRMMLKLPDGIRLMVQGLERVRVVRVLQEKPYLQVEVETATPSGAPVDPDSLEAMRRTALEQFSRIVSLSSQLPDDLQTAANSISDPAALADFIAANLPISVAEKQTLLDAIDPEVRLKGLLVYLTREAQMLELQGKIQSEVSSEVGKTQRDYYLREQLKAIQKELGEAEPGAEELADLRQRLEAAELPAEAKKEAERELERLSKMPPQAAEYTVSRTYLDWILSLPWNKGTEDRLEIPEVKRILDEDHWGLEKIKDRLLEYLSVRRFRPDGRLRQPILCLVGPPGVGKTSLGRSIARALGREFVRMSLGGMRDEAEIRGHRRTYIGSMPGQIIQGIRRVEANNPVFMLDEVDKIGMDFRGDPTSALLEVLDPEQNNTFRDHYLDVPFDLSRILFITTANLIDPIPGPLRDRMEVLELSGYTEDEKLHIAKRHLVPKQLGEHGLKQDEHITFEDSGLLAILRGHTREAGVRNLERQIAAICRKTAREFAEGRTEPVRVDAEQVRRALGSPRFEWEELRDRVARPGVATGLAWTPVGGDVLLVECASMPAEGQREMGLRLTGMLGDVMKESAQIALSWVRSHASEIGIPPEALRGKDLHLHVPAGAIPKDGPSAGITLATCLVSLLSGRLERPEVAMTGELTLTGRVLPVGGIKEKILAAHRVGVKRIVLSERNRKDVEEDVPEAVRKDLEFVFCANLNQVLDAALLPAETSQA
ncbi:MAG TPA: endopeptidase La [Armatimonadota bacterium]